MELTEQDCPNVPAHMRIALNAWVAEYDELRQYKIDAQATIAALQAQLTQLDRTVADVYAQRDGLQKDLAQRTAELEAANQRVLDERNLSNSWMKKHDELLAKVHKSGQFGAVVVQDVLKERDTLQAELERVRDQFADLRKMVAALPRVEGEVTVRDITALYWTSDGTYGSIDCKEQFVSLLKHRQGME